MQNLRKTYNFKYQYPLYSLNNLLKPKRMNHYEHVNHM
jgi:hypothetical protein